MISLGHRLLLLIGVAQVILVVGTFWLSYDKGRHEAEELLDGQLVLSMRLIEAQIHHDSTLYSDALSSFGVQNTAESPYTALIELIDDQDRGKYEPELAFGVWDAKGRQVLRSNNAEKMPLLTTAGFDQFHMSDREWRVFSKTTPTSHYRLQVAHPVDTRDQAGLEVAERVTYPMLFSLPLLLAAIYYAIWVSLRPVNQLVRDVNKRSGSYLEPIALQGVLKELRPVVSAFNNLLDKLSKSIESERRFTADAAHELRSPLAGLKIQAQVASATDDPATQRKAIENLLLGVRRSERLVEQLLRLARLEPEQTGALSFSPVALKYLLLEALDATQAERTSKQQSVDLDQLDDDIAVLGDHDLLLVLAVNILSNAIKYSPVSSSLVVKVRAVDQSVSVSFRDQGPGIPADELSQITKPFRRGRAAQGEGSGLGLAIVERIAELHRATLSLRNLSPVGLEVEVRFEGITQ